MTILQKTIRQSLNPPALAQSQVISLTYSSWRLTIIALGVGVIGVALGAFNAYMNIKSNK